MYETIYSNYRSMPCAMSTEKIVLIGRQSKPANRLNSRIRLKICCVQLSLHSALKCLRMNIEIVIWTFRAINYSSSGKLMLDQMESLLYNIQPLSVAVAYYALENVLLRPFYNKDSIELTSTCQKIFKCKTLSSNLTVSFMLSAITF